MLITIIVIDCHLYVIDFLFSMSCKKETEAVLTGSTVGIHFRSLISYFFNFNFVSKISSWKNRNHFRHPKTSAQKYIRPPRSIDNFVLIQNILVFGINCFLILFNFISFSWKYFYFCIGTCKCLVWNYLFRLFIP